MTEHPPSPGEGKDGRGAAHEDEEPAEPDKVAYQRHGHEEFEEAVDDAMHAKHVFEEAMDEAEREADHDSEHLTDG